MALEIERKFLVTGSFDHEVTQRLTIVQGYLSTVPERTVRVRIRGEEGFLTIKGIGNESGAARYEWERAIPLQEAGELLRLCEPGVIRKTRCLVAAGLHTYEIDIFHDENEGLVIAEIELGSEDESFSKPAWLGPEITGDLRYYNASLMKMPFIKW